MLMVSFGLVWGRSGLVFKASFQCSKLKAKSELPNRCLFWAHLKLTEQDARGKEPTDHSWIGGETPSRSPLLKHIEAPDDARLDGPPFVASVALGRSPGAAWRCQISWHHKSPDWHPWLQDWAE